MCSVVLEDRFIRKLLEFCVPVKLSEFQMGRLLIWINFIPEKRGKLSEHKECKVFKEKIPLPASLPFSTALPNFTGAH